MLLSTNSDLEKFILSISKANKRLISFRELKDFVPFKSETELEDEVRVFQEIEKFLFEKVYFFDFFLKSSSKKKLNLSLNELKNLIHSLENLFVFKRQEIYFSVFDQIVYQFIVESDFSKFLEFINLVFSSRSSSSLNNEKLKILKLNKYIETKLDLLKRNLFDLHNFDLKLLFFDPYFVESFSSIYSNSSLSKSLISELLSNLSSFSVSIKENLKSLLSIDVKVFQILNYLEKIDQIREFFSLRKDDETDVFFKRLINFYRAQSDSEKESYSILVLNRLIKIIEATTEKTIQHQSYLTKKSNLYVDAKILQLDLVRLLDFFLKKDKENFLNLAKESFFFSDSEKLRRKIETIKSIILEIEKKFLPQLSEDEKSEYYSFLFSKAEFFKSLIDQTHEEKLKFFNDDEKRNLLVSKEMIVFPELTKIFDSETVTEILFSKEKILESFVFLSTNEPIIRSFLKEKIRKKPDLLGLKKDLLDHYRKVLEKIDFDEKVQLFLSGLRKLDSKLSTKLIKDHFENKNDLLKRISKPFNFSDEEIREIILSKTFEQKKSKKNLFSVSRKVL